MNAEHLSEAVALHTGNALEVLRTLPDESVNCCVTSPPYYGLRKYLPDGHPDETHEIGTEETPAAFIANLVAVFREVRRVLTKDGVCFVNLGDSYSGGGVFSPGSPSNQNGGSKSARQDAGSGAKPAGRRTPKGIKTKDLIGIPWMFAFAARDDGWYLRQDIIWAKPNPMPESIQDRCVKSHEYVFLLTKSANYYWDHSANQEPAVYAGKGRGGSTNRYEQNAAGMDNKTYDTRTRRSVWTVCPVAYREAHFATFSPDLIRPMIQVGCPKFVACDCNELVLTPTGKRVAEDPSMETGRAGMNRPRGDSEGRRPITRRRQREEAAQLKASPHRDAIREACGQAFAHYVRTDASGARPLPESVRQELYAKGWLTPTTECDCGPGRPGVVLDPFAGSGTTIEVAVMEGRHAVGIELNPEYGQLIRDRMDAIYQRQPGSLFAGLE